MFRQTPFRISKDEYRFSNLGDISSAPQATELKKNILENLNELENNFNQLHLDAIFLVSRIPDSLSANQSYIKLTELFSKTKEKKEEINKLKISFLKLIGVSEEFNKLGEQITKLKTLFLWPQNDDVKIEENSIPNLEYLQLLDKSVRYYQTDLEEYQKNFTELNQEIRIIENEASKMAGKNIESLTSLKSYEYEDDIDSTDHISHKNLEEYFFEFFYKIEQSKEKLNNLKSELDDFCLQQSYLDLAENNDLKIDKITKKMNLAIKIKDCQYKILQNLEIIDSYENQFWTLVNSEEFPSGFDKSNLITIKMSSFYLEIDKFINSYSLDKFKTELQSLSSLNDYAIEISNNPRVILPSILGQPESSMTIDSLEIEPINPQKLFQEVLKNLLDSQQQNTNSIIVLGQEVSSNCSLFEKLKCFSVKGVDEDEQPTISYFLIKNKLVKLTYNSQDLINSSEPNSGNLNHQNGDQFSRFSSEEILEKLNELEKIKLRFITSRASNHQDSPQNPSSDLSQSFLNNFKIEIVENTNLHQDRSIPKSIKKEVDKLLESNHEIMASLTFNSPNPEAGIKDIKALSSNSGSEITL